MLKLEYLKIYATANDIQLYKKNDQLGKLYQLIGHLISAWEKEIKRGVTIGVPQYIQDRSLELATRFVKVCGFSKDRDPCRLIIKPIINKNESDKQFLVRREDFNNITKATKKIHAWILEKSNEFFLNRMEEMGVQDQSQLLTTITDSGESFQVPVFSCDATTGNIEILVTRLNGAYVTYDEKEKKGEEEFTKTYNYKIVRRAQPSAEYGKYKIPSAKGTYPFFSEKLKVAYAQETSIETLFITEGAFKAFKGCIEGLHVVGLSSISHYRDAKSTKRKPKLHKDIISLIETCKVKNVVILWDGDCKDINQKDLSLEQDLSTRPRNFFNFAKITRDLVINEKFTEAPKVYFGTIKSDSIKGSPKGIDDLLIEVAKVGEKELERCVKAATKFEKGNPFFYFCHITKNTDTLSKYFALQDVDKFYHRHVESIETKEFIYKGDRYKYIEAINELTLLQPEFLQNLRWIGDDFFQVIEVPIPSKDGSMQTMVKLDGIKKSTLKELYGAKFMRFMKDMHYTRFCNIPNHFEYQFELKTKTGKYYNKYFPFEHVPSSGVSDTIKNFVKHIFGDQYEMGLDYIQLLLLQPTQKLPVICLYSPENATGKSKFGELLAQIFKNNVLFINNDDLKSEFGLDRFADKLVAVCDETLLERKKDVERIKFVSTAEEALTINPKGMSAYALYTYVKLIFNSNNLRMIHATENDERFWIIRVPVPKEKDPDLIEKMKEEIPAFVDYLKNRKLSTKRQGRMWFAPHLIKTETLEQVVRVNEHSDVQELRSKLEDYFIDFPKESVLLLSTKDLIEEFMTGKTRAWMDEICTNRLKIDRYQKDGKTVVKRGYVMHKTATFLDGGTTYDNRKMCKSPQRVWVFKREDFVLEELEYEEELTQDFMDKVHSEI